MAGRVVATDAGGIPDLVDRRVEGLLIPPADTDALVDALGARARRPRARRAARRGRAASATRDWHSTPEQLRGRACATLVDAHGRRDGAECGSSSSRRRSTPTTRRSRRRSTSSRALAARCRASRRALRLASGAHDLPANVARPDLRRRQARWSRRCASSGRSRPSCCGSRDPTPCSSHMVPLFVVLAAPLARPRARPAAPLVHALARRPVAAARDAARRRRAQRRPRLVPARLPKVHGIGHAIDVDRFAPSRRTHRPDGPLRLLALGRTARWKGYDTLLEALELATERGLDAQLEIRGPQLTDDERRTGASSRRSCAAVGRLRDRVRIEPPLARDEIPACSRAADALAQRDPAARRARRSTRSSTRPRPAGCRCSRATPRSTSSSAACRVELRFRPRDAEELADRLLAFAAAGPAARARRGRGAAPPRRRRPLASTRGRTRSRRSLPPRRPRVTSSPWRRSPPEPASSASRDARRPRGAAVRPLARRRCGRSDGACSAIAVARGARHGRARRSASTLALVLRSVVFGDPILWSLLWETGPAEWLPFLIPITLLVFWQAGLYAAARAPRRARAGRLVARARRADRRSRSARAPDYDFTTSGPDPDGAASRARSTIGAAPRRVRVVHARAAAAAAVRAARPARRRRRAPATRCERMLAAARRRHRVRVRRRRSSPGRGRAAGGAAARRRGPTSSSSARAASTRRPCSSSSRRRTARGVRVRIAPKTTELLLQRGEYVPGQGVPLFELRPPVLAGTDWA